MDKIGRIQVKIIFYSASNRCKWCLILFGYITSSERYREDKKNENRGGEGGAEVLLLSCSSALIISFERWTSFSIFQYTWRSFPSTNKLSSQVNYNSRLPAAILSSQFNSCYIKMCDEQTYNGYSK